MPEAGLSKRDIHWVKELYPEISDSDFINLEIGESQFLANTGGEQKSFIFKPKASGKYSISTLGKIDGIMVLFKKDRDGNLIYLSGDDDSGKDINAKIEYRLLKNEEYIISHRKYYSSSNNNNSIIIN